MRNAKGQSTITVTKLDYGTVSINLSIDDMLAKAISPEESM